MSLMNDTGRNKYLFKDIENPHDKERMKNFEVFYNGEQDRKEVLFFYNVMNQYNVDAKTLKVHLEYLKKHSGSNRKPLVLFNGGAHFEKQSLISAKSAFLRKFKHFVQTMNQFKNELSGVVYMSELNPLWKEMEILPTIQNVTRNMIKQQDFIVHWDSNLLLHNQYREFCLKHHFGSASDLDAKDYNIMCWNRNHPGRFMFEHSLTQLLNYVHCEYVAGIN